MSDTLYMSDEEIEDLVKYATTGNMTKVEKTQATKLVSCGNDVCDRKMFPKEVLCPVCSRGALFLMKQIFGEGNETL